MKKEHLFCKGIEAFKLFDEMFLADASVEDAEIFLQICLLPLFLNLSF